MKNLYLSYFLFYSIIASSETILCELKGTFEETSEVPKTNYLQDVGDAIKNFTTSAYTGFLVQKAKENISDNWNKEDFFVNQYWNKDQDGTLILMDYEIDPAINWIIEQTKKKENSKLRSTELIETFESGLQHPFSEKFKVDYYKIINSINRYTGKGRIEGNIWLSGMNVKNLKSPKISFIARGVCGKLEEKF